MISPETLTQIKQIPITDYLQTLGNNPVNQSGKELIYYSPYNQEATPSFMVDPIKNVFHDHSGEGEKGDIIRLVQYLSGCSFVDAVKTLQRFDGKSINAPFSFRGLTSSKPESARIEIVSVQPLRNRALWAYITSRKISPTVAANYLNEVHYQLKEKRYYAVGFRNDKGGFALRNAYFQNCTSPNWFTLIPAQATNAVNVFEGVFDFLSCCEYFGISKLKNPTIILNSLSFLNEALPIVSRYQTVNAFLDNDKAGKGALSRLVSECTTVRDCSHYYPNSKDFNDFLIHHQFP